jgi:hypothetical protein
MNSIIKNTIGLLPLLFAVLLFGCKEDEITNIAAETLIIDPTAVTLDPGETAQLSATVMPEQAGNRAVFWKSDNEKIVTVDNGVLTAKAAGSATVIAVAYSNTAVSATVAVTVTGVPEDLAAAVAGTYIGDVTLGGMPIATDVVATLTAADNKVRLATTAATGMGTLAMDIEVDVERDGEGFRISGTGTSTMGAVSVSGTIDAAGRMVLTITLTDAGAEVVFTAARGQTPVEAVSGIYNGTVGIPMLGDIPGIELTLTPDGSRVNLATTVDVPSVGTLALNVPMTVARAGNDYTVSGTGTTDLFGTVGISGTVSAGGAISLIIHIDANGLDVTYTGQKLEDLAALIAGTYTGKVSAQGMGDLTGNDVAMVLTAVTRTTVHWATQTETTLGVSFAVSDFELTVARSGADFTIAGSGTSSVGPLTVAGTITAAGHVVVNMTTAALPVPITYEGDK